MARVYLEALHHLQPSPESALELAALHRQCHDFAQGLAHLREADARWPGRVDLLRAQAELAMLAKAFEAAGELWQRLISADGMAGSYPVLRRVACLRQMAREDAAQCQIAACATALEAQLSKPAVELLRSPVSSRVALVPGLYLVTGNNGTGKTTVGHFLQALGFHTIDADIDIAAFCDGHRWAILRHDLSRGRPEIETGLRWLWPRARFEEACGAFGDLERVVFVIGGFGQAVAPYIHRFDKVFHLTAPTDVIAHRLEKRGSPSHRKGSPGYRSALRRNTKASSPPYPAHIIKADRPVWQICEVILASLGARPSQAAKPVRAALPICPTA